MSRSDRWPALDVTARRTRLAGGSRVAVGPLASLLSAAHREIGRSVFSRDPALWSPDPAVQARILNRLGWLSSPELMAGVLPRLEQFSNDIRDHGFTDVVLLGMGGSSLAPEVMRAILGVAPERPRFHVLDSVDPAAVRAAATPPATTLYILASKSGTTIEPNVLAAHFQRTLLAAGTADWARHFVAITDDSTFLHDRATRERFREVFINPSDIGGRYSALSYFGLVPAALMGIDVDALVGWSLAMLDACEAEGRPADNPGVALGAFMGAAARGRRDKLTLLLPPDFEPFGLWVEQLVAESTGKAGTGIAPICGESLAAPSFYGDDRAFVRMRLRGSGAEERRDTAVRDLVDAGAPLFEIDLPEPVALGAEFVRWEIATATAGMLLHINPFDEPNVQQAKDETRRLLDVYRGSQQLPLPAADATRGGITFTLSQAARDRLGSLPPEALLTLLQPGEYVALLAYLDPDEAAMASFAAWRDAIRARSGAATMFGVGPRYLHSTGQLHKGGPNSGVFIIVTATPNPDLPIPGEPFSFGVLELAQALGDFGVLNRAGRRALHVHLPAPSTASLITLREAVTAHMRRLER